MNNDVLILENAKRVFEVEARELRNVAASLNHSFVEAVNDIYNAKGKCIVTGMGKSGIIGRKIAASLASTGTSSFFVHPGEAFHGDLGMFEKDDIVIMLSNSGETDEVLKLLSFFQYQGNKTIAITGNLDSTLAKNSTHHLLCKVDKEACPLQLAPTSSTTAALAMGDAIVVSLIELRQFKPENFARFHPGGSLGRKLLTYVKDIMVTTELPLVSSEESIKDVIHKISKSGFGVAIQVDNKNRLEGLITDGDVRRAMEHHELDFFSLKANSISTKKPVVSLEHDLLSEIELKMSKSKIRSLVVIDDNRIVKGLVFI